jgi:hypothetical protein
MTTKTSTAELTPFQQQTVAKIKALQNLTATMGMRTNRSVLDILNKLNAEDLAAVSLVLYPVPVGTPSN